MVFDMCPCGSGKGYLACCGRLHTGGVAETAEAVMRARYTAYTRCDAAYLLKTWAPETRPPTVPLDPRQVWTGLTVSNHTVTGPDTATVRFKARWRIGATKGRIIETSRFRKDAGAWFYLDGKTG